MSDAMSNAMSKLQKRRVGLSFMEEDSIWGNNDESLLVLAAAIKEEKEWIKKTLKYVKDKMNELVAECLMATDYTRTYIDGMLIEEMENKSKELEKVHLGLKKLYDNHRYETIIKTRDWVKHVFFEGRASEEECEKVFFQLMVMFYDK